MNVRTWILAGCVVALALAPPLTALLKQPY
jgi:hypothetical protein